MLHEPHSSVSWPALLIIVAHHVLIVRIRVLSQIALNEVSSLLMGEAKQYMNPIYIPRIKPDWMPSLNFCVPVSNEFVWHLWWASNLAGSSQPKKQKI